MPDDGTQVERDASAPEQPLTEHQPDGEEHVYLPGILSDEFGVARSQARVEILMGVVTIDGEVYTPTDGLSIPRSLCEGKTIEVAPRGDIPGQRTYRLQITPA